MTVTRFEIIERSSFADGKSFGDHGAYVRLLGRAHLEVDPGAGANEAIVDLALARDGDGLVRFSTDFELVMPEDPAKGVDKLLVDVPNRGNRLVAPTLHRAPAVVPEDRLKPGDGFLCHRGWSYISIGWQWDAEGDIALRLHPPVATIDGAPVRGEVMMKFQPATDRAHLALMQLGQTSPPYPVVDPDGGGHRLYAKPHENAERVEIDNSRWRFARTSKGEVVASDRHIWLEDGFAKGQIYELVYQTENAPVVGAGLIAVREIASCLKHGEEASPVNKAFDHAYGFGVSQTGRFLRQFLHDGQNVDEAGRKVFDGLWLHIAGAQRGDFNFRFAQPTVATVPSLGQRFPFSTSATKDLFSDNSGGLLDNLTKELRPKVIISNTSFEYWRGDASLGHIMGNVDLPPDPDTRIYLIAGTHHIGGLLVGGKQFTRLEAMGLDVAMPLNTVNAAPISRALVVMLDEWVSAGVAPAPSCHPRLDDGTAVTRQQVLESFADAPAVSLLAPEKLLSIKRQVEQPMNVAGQVRHPVEEGEAYPAYVSAVDDTFNEVAGIRLPDISCPLGMHTGWNPSGPDTGAGDQAAIFAGFTLFFPKEDVLARYPELSAYLTDVESKVNELVKARFVLEQDRQWLMELATERYKVATA